MMSKLLSILVPVLMLMLSFDTYKNGVDQKNCDNFRVKLEVTQPGEQNNLEGLVKVEVQNAKSPIKYIFFTEDKKKVLSTDFTKDTLTDIKKGSYFCLVVDGNGCNKEIKFTVK